MHTTRKRRRALHKKPTAARFLWLMLVSVPAVAWAQSAPLTEDAVVTKGLDSEVFEEVRAGLRGAIEGASVEVSVWDNPSLGYQREQLFGAPADLDTVMLSQSFDLSGRRGLRQAAARTRGDSQLKALEWAETRYKAQVRARFYEVVYQQALVEALDAWSGHLRQVRDIIEDRAEAGDASRLELGRIEGALALAEVRRDAQANDRERAWDGLAVLVGGLEGGDWPRVQTGLMPSEAVGDPSVSDRADIRTLGLEIEALEQEAKAAARGWVPELEVGLGYLRQSGGGEQADGFTIALSLSLPLFERSQGVGLSAKGRARVVAAEQARVKARAERHAAGALRQWSDRRALAEAFVAEVERAQELAAMARDAYEGNALGLGELLNVYEHLSEVQQQAIELRWQARRAALEALGAMGDHP